MTDAKTPWLKDDLTAYQRAAAFFPEVGLQGDVGDLAAAFEAHGRAAYLRGLEDAGAAIRNACNCDLALDAIRALAEVADDHTPVKHTTASASYVRGRAIAAAIWARAKEEKK